MNRFLFSVAALALASSAWGAGTVDWPSAPLPLDANPAATPLSPISGWLNRFQENRIASRKVGQVDVVFDGDQWAITAGPRGGNGGMWNRFAKLNPVEFGSQGDRTQNVLWRLQNGQADGLHPRLVALLVGSSNIGFNTPEQIADGVKAVIAEYRKRCPEATIVLQAVLPRGEKPIDPLRDKVKAVNQLLATLADGQKVIYLDFGDKLLQPDGTLGKDVMADFTHPSGKAYQIWGDALQPVIDRFLPPGSSVPAAPVEAAAEAPAGGTVAWPPPTPSPDGNSATIPAPQMSWLPRFQENIDASRKMPQVDVVFDGDSITAGWLGGGGGIWNHRFAALNAFDFGISGDSTQGLLWRLRNGQVDGLHPRLVVLLIGTNNMYSCSAEQIAGGVKADVDEYRKRLPDATILLQGIFPRGQHPDDPLRAKVKAVNQLLATLADGQKVIFLDFGDTLLQPDGTYGPPITNDFLHPSAPGYQIWADAIQPVLARFFPPAS